MPADIVKHINKKTIALTLQLVNSRHGMVQPIADIARACREKSPSLFIHTDAAQATAYYTCSPITLGADTVTIDSTKKFRSTGESARFCFKNQACMPGWKVSAVYWIYARGLRQSR